MGLIVSKTYNNSKTPESLGSWNYKYDETNRLIYEGVGDEAMDKKHTYIYNEKGQLIESTDECGYIHRRFGYKYDEMQRMIMKYERGGTSPTEYEYSGHRLTKEIHHNRNRKTEITYEFNDIGLLLIKREEGNVIIKNIYNNGRLVERWDYYFGIDPGYYPCHSQYISKYEYY
jgi:hypothetical protein